MIKIGVVGACGKMGSEVVKLAINNPEFELACAIDKFNVGEKITEQVSIEEDITKQLKKTNQILLSISHNHLLFLKTLKHIKN